MNGEPGRLRRIDATGVPNLLARYVLGALFIYMGYQKAMDPYGFLKLLREYDLFPADAYTLMNLVATALPWLEIFCGILLILGIAIRGTALVLLVMMVSFTTVVIVRAVGIHQAQNIPFCKVEFDCGCGGGPINICRKLVENTGLTLLSLLLVWSRSTLVLTNLLAPRAAGVR